MSQAIVVGLIYFRYPDSITVCRLVAISESNIREHQAGFSPGRGPIDHIFTFQRLLKTHSKHPYSIIDFLGLKGTFDAVDRTISFSAACKKAVPEKFVSLLPALSLRTYESVMVYDEFSLVQLVQKLILNRCAPVLVFTSKHNLFKQQ